jgi:hypothetical protein
MVWTRSSYFAWCPTTTKDDTGWRMRFDAFPYALITNYYPELDTETNVFIVTDQEKAITEAIRKISPNLKTFICWNHILKDVKRWLQSHGVSTQREAMYYSDSVRLILQSTY